MNVNIRNTVINISVNITNTRPDYPELKLNPKAKPFIPSLLVVKTIDNKPVDKIDLSINKSIDKSINKSIDDK